MCEYAFALITFKSFIINLKKLQILDNDNILKLYNTNIDNVVNMLDKQFKEYYDDEISKGIIDKSVTYDNYLIFS